MSRLIERVAGRANVAMRDEMERLKAIVVARNSIPVEHVGGRTIRSKPGEAPRKDSGAQVASAAAQTIDSNQSVRGSVSLTSAYVRKLVRIRRVPFGPVLKDNSAAIRAALRVAIVHR